MAKLPRLTGKQLSQILVNHQFELVRIKGSHHRFRHRDGRVTTVPIHVGETIGPGLLRKIMRDARLESSDLSND